MNKDPNECAQQDPKKCARQNEQRSNKMCLKWTEVQNKCVEQYEQNVSYKMSKDPQNKIHIFAIFFR